MSVSPTESAPAPTAPTFAILGALGAAAGIVASVVRSKVTAHAVGPTGVGVVAEVTQVVALATSVAAVAGGPVLIAWVASAKRDGDAARLHRGLGSATVLGFVFAALGACVSVAIAPWVLPAHVSSLRLWAALAGFSAVCSTLTAVFQAALIGTSNVRATTIATLATTVAGAVCVVSLTLGLGLAGLFLGLALGNVLGLTATVALVRTNGLPSRPAWDKHFVHHAFLVGATTLVASVLSQLSTSSMRVVLAWAGGATNGAAFNGNYQAAAQIGTQYFAAVLAGLSNYFFPRFSAAKGSEELRIEVYAAADFVLRLAPPIVFAAIALRGPLIQALYSHRFDLAVDMLGYQLAGDIPKAVSWAYAGPLLFRGELRGFLLTEAFGTAIAILSNYLVVRWLGPAGAGLATTITYVSYVFFAAFVLGRTTGVTPRWSHAYRSVALCAIALGIESLTRRWPVLRWAVLAVSTVWIWRLGAADYLRQRATRMWQKIRRT